MDAPTRHLSEFVGGRVVASLTPAAVHGAARHLIDTVGYALGAVDSRPAEVARSIASSATRAGRASVFGMAGATTPEYAAFANAVMVRYLDYNDTGHGAHPSDTIPAVLALAEVTRAAGRVVVAGMHAAYETYVAVRRGGLHGDLLRRRHVDQIYASLGGAAAAGVVLGLDARRAGNAFSLALTPSVPLRVTRTGSVSDWKGCATAHCAMASVFAARLAERGLTGPARPFEGLGGLCDMIGVGSIDLASIGQPRDGRGAIETTALKRFPAEYSAQGPIESVLTLRDGLNLDQIEQLTVFLHWSGWHEIGGGAGDLREKLDPSTRETAGHSLPYIVAVALTDGEVNIASFDDTRRSDPALRRLMKRIVIREDPVLTAAYAGEVPRWPSRVEIRLRGGGLLRRECSLPKGHPANPLTDGELEAKFLALAERAVPRTRGQRILETLWRIDELDDVRTLTRQLRLVGRARVE